MIELEQDVQLAAYVFVVLRDCVGAGLAAYPKKLVNWEASLAAVERVRPHPQSRLRARPRQKPRDL